MKNVLIEQTRTYVHVWGEAFGAQLLAAATLADLRVTLYAWPPPPPLGTWHADATTTAELRSR